MADDEPHVPIHCSECETTTRTPLSTVADAIERHNEGVHDGREVAEVDPAIKESLADIVAEELGLLDD